MAPQALVALLAVAAASAAEDPPATPRLEVHGFADVVYAYDFEGRYDRSSAAVFSRDAAGAGTPLRRKGKARLGRILDACTGALPVAAVVVRDPRGYVLAASRGAHGRPPPDEILDPDTLLPSLGGRSLRRNRFSLPEDGGRLALVAGPHQVGGLDLWGSGQRASPRSRLTLSDVARLVALLMLD